MVNPLAAVLPVNILLRSSNEFRQKMYKVESTAEQAIVVENYFNQLLAEGNLMSDVQVEQVNLLETH